MMSAIGMVRPIVNVPHGLSGQRVDHDQPEHRDQDDHDREHADQRRDARRPARSPRVAIWPSDLPSRRIEANRIDQVLHRTAKHDADEDPDRAGQVAELRGQHRPDQRTRAGDRREVVAEDDPPVGRHEVLPVVEPIRRRRPRVVERETRCGERPSRSGSRSRTTHSAATRNQALEIVSPRVVAIVASATAPSSATPTHVAVPSQLRPPASAAR